LRTSADFVETYSPKKAIPGDMGFVAYFLDTEKNVMGVWSMK
jgi:predicted enzyme related to lactoylglutathione lyase